MPAPPFSLVIEIGLHSHCFGSPLNIVLSESDGVCMSIAKTVATSFRAQTSRPRLLFVVAFAWLCVCAGRLRMRLTRRRVRRNRVWTEWQSFWAVV